jgi:hypothetical protein
MVLKRKLPTQEAKVEKKEVETVEDNFDMSIETDEKPAVKAEEGHDLNDDFPDQVEDKPEDFIPAELKALESDNAPVMDEPAADIKPAAEVLDNKELKQEQENEDIAPVSFDEPEDAFSMKLDDEPVATEPVTFEEPKEENVFNQEPAPVFEEKTEEPVLAETPVFEDQPVKEDTAPVFDTPTDAPVEFETQEHANWQEVVESKNDDHKDDNFDSFETIAWDDNSAPAKKEEAPTMEDERFADEEKDAFSNDPFGGDNGGVVPEIPGLEFNTNDEKPAEVMGANSQELTLNGDAKRKLMLGVIGTALVAGGIFVYSNMGTTTEVTNRWSGALTEANQDIPETKEEEAALLEDGVDITKTETVVDFSELSSDDGEMTSDMAALSELDEEESDPATEINLLEPEVVEKTASGKEVIKATGEEEMPEDVEEGVNLITNITEAYEKQKAADKGIDLEKEVSEQEQKENLKENAADMNKKVDEQLAEYRKLLAAEEDPGKKVKPGAFFKGEVEENEAMVPASANVAKVTLVDTKAGEMPENYVATAQAVDGHQIVAYPKGVARQPDEGIRQLDHFRSLMVEKEDKRVRMPKGVKPGLRNQGFPQFKVISIVPNYGLIGEYEAKKGILMIGDSFQGWELVGVYESYAEFTNDTTKHIISVR